MKREKSYLIFNDLMSNILKVILVFSNMFLTILLSNRFLPLYILFGAILSFFISIILFFKIFKIKKVDIKKLLFSIFMSLFIIKQLLLFVDTNGILINEFIFRISGIKINATDIIGLMSLPSLSFYINLFIEKINIILGEFKKDLTRVEKKYLFIMLIVAFIISTFTIRYTTAFSKPEFNENLIPYDVMYTSDTGYIAGYDAYFNVSNPENDIRQPLFGIFAFPFAVVAKILGELCFFLPTGFEYVFFLTIIQFLLLTVSTILIGKILNLEEKEKKYLYLLFSCSFPYLLFGLILEQYVIGLFYLILAIYISHVNKDSINYMYIGAVGTLLTSGIIFPVITKLKNAKQYIADIIKCFLVFCTIFIVGGQFPQILTCTKTFKTLQTFSGDLFFYDKFCQFTSFVKGLFIPQHGAVVISDFPSYRLQSPSLSIIGIIILIILIISFILNRKLKMAKISILWILFSFIILCLKGWGTPENGLILYSLYFAFAYYVLYFLLIKKLFKNKILFKCVMTFSIILILFFNIMEIINIFEFAFKYY